MSVNLIDEVLNSTPLYGEGIGATSLWSGGYAFAAAVKFVTAIIGVVLVHLAARRGRSKVPLSWARLDLMVRASLPAALYPFILYLFFSAIGDAFVFNNIFGFANLMSIHVPDTITDYTGVHLSDGLSGAVTNHGNNFFSWIIPTLFNYSGVVFLAIGLSLLARLEFQTSVMAGCGGFGIAMLVFLSFINSVQSHWALMITGGLVVSVTLPFLLYFMAEVRGFVLMGFMLLLPIYTGLMYLVAALSSWQLMTYSTDTMYIWTTTVFPGIHVLTFLAAFVLGNYMTPKIVDKTMMTGASLAGTKAWN